MAPPAYVQTRSTSVDLPANPYSAPLPTGLTTGNFLVMVVSLFKTAGTGIVTPTGFTALTSTSYSTGNGLIQVFWRRIDGTEGTTVSTSYNGTIYALFEFYEYSGVVASPTDPLDGTPVASAEQGAGTTCPAPSYTTALNDSTIIDVVNSVGNTTYTAARGTKRSDTYQASAGIGAALADTPMAAAGTDAGGNWTFSGSQTKSRALVFAITAGGAPTVTFVPQIIIL